MKKIIIIALLGMVSLGAKAQTFTATNNEFCDVSVTPVCYDPHTCSIVSSDPPVLIPCCGGTASVTTSSCTPGMTPAFEICWQSTLCTGGICTIVDATSAGCYPSPAKLAPCSDCIQPPSQGLVDCDYISTLTIH